MIAQPALTVPPFVIDAMGTTITAEPGMFRAVFAKIPALVFQNVLAPNLLAKLLQRAANARFVEDDVADIGTRQIEDPQHIGGSISLLAGRPNLFAWLEQVTGCTPVRALSGRLVQTRSNDRDELAWHDDTNERDRLLGVVINLSDQPFTGGDFELRRKGEQANLLAFRHTTPGSMMIFAVRPDLEHRVSAVRTGGPRRVYAGWMLSAPEHPGRGIFK